MGTNWSATVVAVALLLAAVAGPTTVPAAADTSPALTETTAGNDAVERTLVVHLTPDDPGHVELVADFDVAKNVTGLDVALPQGATVIERTGFETRGGQWTYTWDGETQTPSIRIRLEANQQLFGSYNFYDAGDWALVPTRFPARFFTDGAETYHSWEDDTLPTTYEAAGEGVVGDRMAFLGGHDALEYESQGRKMTLVVPDTTQVDTSAVFGTLTYAMDNLDVHYGNDDIRVFVAPDPIRRGGLQAGNTDMWVHHSGDVNDPDNVWVHEYIHTRQRFTTTHKMDWFFEGSADYMTALLTYQENRITFDEFYQHVSTDRDAASQLSSEDRWTSEYAEYTKGRRVLAALDAEIRQATGGTNTVEDVFYLLNVRGEEVTVANFQEAVVDVSGDESLRDWVERYVTTDAVPEVPENESLFAEPEGPLDSDDDGLTDAEENRLGLNRLNPDTDGDGIDDQTERELGTDPTKKDTDGDGLDDGTEREFAGTDPTVADTDGDGLDDGTERYDTNTDPTKADTDGDGVPDGEDAAPTDASIQTATATSTPEPTESATEAPTTTPVATETTTPTADGSESAIPGFGVGTALAALAVVGATTILGRRD
ncbi:hypothetical protein [Haloarchaeobius sp. TZWSO28]|uniref:hypothetical protein n=1 Tax=Haloarchaeobius sp. TZWSO28 TaxID=3446119 RepID=UPI003EBEC792